MASDTTWRWRWNSVLNGLRTMEQDAEVEDFLKSLPSRKGPVTVAFVNAHVMNLLLPSNSELIGPLRRTDYVLRDGIGMAILLRLLGRAPGMNLNGTDLIPRILHRARGHRLALLGTRNPYLENAAQAICAQIGLSRSDITVDDGFHDDSHYLELVRKHRPQFIVLGMGVPKQERVATLLKDNLDYDCVIVSGGAIVDFYGGKVRRAPALLRAMRMEWLFRLGLEPRRLFRRYLLGNPTFLLHSLQFRLGSRSHAALAAPEFGNTRIIRQ